MVIMAAFYIPFIMLDFVMQVRQKEVGPGRGAELLLRLEG